MNATNWFLHSANLWAGNVLHFAWPMLWQSSLLIAVIWALDVALRRKARAAVRYALWLLVLLKLVLPPSLSAPTGLGWWVRSTPPPLPPRYQTRITTFVPAETFAPVSAAPMFIPPPPKPERLSRSSWACLLSGSVSLALLVWVLLRWRSVARQGWRGAPGPVWLAEMIQEERRRAGLRGSVRLRLTDQAMSPAVCGLFRPVILLPKALVNQLPPASLRSVLLHELIHLRRGDVWVSWAQALLQIVYWWHPLVWLANSCIRRAREEAVDDAVVVALQGQAECYAPTLLAVARLGLPRSLAALGLVGILESRSALRRRVERLVNRSAPRRAGLTLTSGLCVLGFAALAVPMGEGPAPAEKAQTAATPTGVTNQAGALGTVVPAEDTQGRQALIAARTEWDKRIAEAAKRVEQLREDLKIPASQAEGSAPGPFDSVPSLSHLNALRIEREAEFVRQQMLLRELKALNGDALIQTLPTAAHDTLLEDLLKQQNDTSQKLAGAEKDYGPQHPEVVKLRAQMEDLRAKIDQRVAGIMAGLAAKVASLGQGLTNLMTEVDKATQEDIEKANRAQPYFEAKRRLETMQQYRAALDAKIAARGSAPSGPKPPAPSQALSNGVSGARSQAVNVLRDRVDRFGAAQQADARSAKDRSAVLLQDGKLFYEMGKLDEADVKLKEAETEDPTNQAARYYLDLVRQARRNVALPRPAVASRTNLVFTGRGRQQIYNKLDRITLETVGPWNTSLGEVVKSLGEEARQRDPEQKGINFIINSSPDNGGTAGAPTMDPKKGLPASAGSGDAVADLAQVGVKIDPPLHNLRLADVLDAIVKTADKPIKYAIEDYAVVFSLKRKEQTPLYFRTIKVDPNTFLAGLSNTVRAAVPPAEAVAAGRAFREGPSSPADKRTQLSGLQVMLRDFFQNLGVELNPPKTLYFNEREGTLLIYATLQDLDVIERVVQTMNIPTPQVRIQAWFVELPEAEAKAFAAAHPFSNSLSCPMVKLTPSQARDQMKRWASLDGAKPSTAVGTTQPGGKLLAEAVVTTLSGRQVQIEATDQAQNTGTNAVSPFTHTLDVIPSACMDGFGVQLGMTTAFVEFLGYDDPGQFVIQATGGETNGGLPLTAQLPLPHFRFREKRASVTLWDGQTVVLGDLAPESASMIEQPVGPMPTDVPLIGHWFRDATGQTNRTHVFVVVTPTLIDPADQRYHTESEMPFAETSFPPEVQPVPMPVRPDMRPAYPAASPPR